MRRTLARRHAATSTGAPGGGDGHRARGVTIGGVSSTDPSPADEPSQPVDTGPTVREEGRQVRDGARRLVFTPSRLTIAAALVVCVGALPLLLSVPWFWLFLFLPLAVIGWVLRVRTTVDPDTVTTRSVTGSRTVPWDDVRGLRLGRRSSVSLVLADDREVALPAVYVRDLPVLSAASGGRFADPTAGD